MRFSYAKRIVCMAFVLVATTFMARAQDKPAAADRKALTAYTGAYSWGPDHMVYVQFWPEVGKDQLVWFDETGDVRALFPLGGDKFFVGVGLAAPKPVQAQVAFHRDAKGQVISVERIEGSAAHVAMRSNIYTQEAVRFQNGITTLEGTLYSPLKAGSVPAIVLVHGSGPADREDTLPFALFLVRHGIAVLTYDKRGVGESTGDWQRTSFQSLADDEIAAVHFLQKHPGIVAGKIGLLGVSQGGWVAPLAASRSKDVAFVVSVSGPGVTPADETLTYMRNEMLANGFNTSDVAQATALSKLAFTYARTGAGWEAYLAERQKDEKTEWFPFMGLSDKKDDPQWEFKRLNFAYDPAPTLAAVKCPVLAFFGGHDLNVVSESNRAVWEAALTKAGNTDYTLLVIPEGNHALMDSKTGSAFEFPELTRFDPEYADGLLRWLNKRLPGVH